LKKNGIQLGKKGIENMLVNISCKKDIDLKIHLSFSMDYTYFTLELFK
jgi:hypothetical protein